MNLAKSLYPLHGIYSHPFFTPTFFYHSFGYVVEGSDFLSAIKEGDIITSAKVTEGLDNFKKANEN
jgi:cyclophilin family peptidyl-prolyl cis-trans isomerase